MRKRIPKILVTGGAGFIGSAFVRLLAKTDRFSLRNGLVLVDKLTYAGDLKRLEEVEGRYKFYKADICNKARIESIFKKEKPQVIINFAAETHVDRSILDSGAFIETNINGTHNLLEASRRHQIKRFIHLSTDEVYGEIKRGRFTEDSPLKPNSPYAASKAAADLLIRSYIRTYGFPAVIIRPCNNYGPWQYPEKFIPLAILRLLRNEKVPVYADGKNVREWLYVEDCAQGILKIIENGKIGEIYNLGSQDQKKNIEVVEALLKILKKEKDMVSFVKDRPGHDLRYSLNSDKVYENIEWRPKVNFKEGLALTVEWCLGYRDWLFSRIRNIPPLYK